MARVAIVTGGLGFIGSHLVECLVGKGWQVAIVDALTYAANTPKTWVPPKSSRFFNVNICDRPALEQIFESLKPDLVFNLAAETHVDRSIAEATPFVESNIVGTYSLLEVVRGYFSTLEGARRSRFRLVQMSTDEVFGSLGEVGKFNRLSSYAPNSPYSSSKAAADHLARAWFQTYGLPTLIAISSNVFGPRQFADKLIPKVVSRVISQSRIPIYGSGRHVRDWIYVSDCVEFLTAVADKGVPGKTYLQGGSLELSNLELVRKICSTCDAKRPGALEGSFALVEHVEDRLGHDFRYAIDNSETENELGVFARPQCFHRRFESTIDWYLERLQF